MLKGMISARPWGLLPPGRGEFREMPEELGQSLGFEPFQDGAA